MKVYLIGDGSSDAVLKYPCGWLLTDLGHKADVQALPEPRPLARLRERIQRALLGQPNLLVVHRDAEKEKWESRRQEIKDALVGLEGPVVGIVPVRMTEAWLLIDEAALRQAAGNTHGKMRLQLPPLNRLEGLPDPKETLVRLLREASGLTGRRLKDFKEGKRILRLAELIRDYSPLRSLRAFQEFEEEVQSALEAAHDFQHAP